MIEWRWTLPALTVRDQTANNLADGLDFTASSLNAKQFDVPIGPFGTLCSAPSSALALNKWEQLRDVASVTGWTI